MKQLRMLVFSLVIVSGLAFALRTQQTTHAATGVQMADGSDPIPLCRVCCDARGHSCRAVSEVFPDPVALLLPDGGPIPLCDPTTHGTGKPLPACPMPNRLTTIKLTT
jgi:hypothetical protein